MTEDIVRQDRPTLASLFTESEREIRVIFARIVQESGLAAEGQKLKK